MAFVDWLFVLLMALVFTDNAITDYKNVKLENRLRKMEKQIATLNSKGN